MVRLYVGPMPLQPFESFALTVIGKLPVCVGVPERTPFDASVKPAGNIPPASENVVVPLAPVWVKVWLNGDPAGPLETAGLMTVMTLQQIGSDGSPAGSDGAFGEQEKLAMVGKRPTAGPFVGNVVPEMATVP